jgi:hypothetical protein
MVKKAIDGLVFVIGSLTSAQLAFAQTTTDQMATETGSGMVTCRYQPGEIIVVGSEGAQETFSLVLDEGLTYVDKTGKTLNRNLIKRDSPIHLYYHDNGHARVIDRVVVDRD